VQGVSPAILEQLEARERAERLWAAIDALPEKLRMAIVLANIEEHDLAEVARLLDIPEGTVKSRLFLARQRLKELLQ
jgi:RNA polymerase sigma-70 factor (ECF subfamily)